MCIFLIADMKSLYNLLLIGFSGCTVLVRPVVSFSPRLAEGIVGLRPNQERQLLEQVSVLLDAKMSSPSQGLNAKRLFRKLELRQKKRELGLPIFNLDREVSKSLNKLQNCSVDLHSNIAYYQTESPEAKVSGKQSRYCMVLSRFLGASLGSLPVTFVHRLIGAGELSTSEEFVSPFTRRFG
eukprot:m.146687 g.146687  ORF g.146687 m.146687 type:complete len:182 (+) comp38452_c0_seq21:589-1134(+)